MCSVRVTFVPSHKFPIDHGPQHGWKRQSTSKQDFYILAPFVSQSWSTHCACLARQQSGICLQICFYSTIRTVFVCVCVCLSVCDIPCRACLHHHPYQYVGQRWSLVFLKLKYPLPAFQVCRSYLCGFCPHDLFTNTKSDLGKSICIWLKTVAIIKCTILLVLTRLWIW